MHERFIRRHVGVALDEQDVSFSVDNGDDDDYGGFGQDQFANNNLANARYSAPAQAGFGSNLLNQVNQVSARQSFSQQNPASVHRNNQHSGGHQQQSRGKHFQNLRGPNAQTPTPAMVDTRTTQAEGAQDAAAKAVTPQNAIQVPNKLGPCQKALRKHIKDKADLVAAVLLLKENVETEQKRNETLQKKIDDLIKKLQQARSSKGVMKAQLSTCTDIRHAYRIFIFRRAKWIRNNADMALLAEKAYDYVFDKEKRDDLGNDYKLSWINTYTKQMKTVVNARRSYIQSQCKLAVFRYYKKHNKMPTLDDMIKCITRDIDVNDEGDYALFEWHWDDLIGKWSIA